MKKRTLIITITVLFLGIGLYILVNYLSKPSLKIVYNLNDRGISDCSKRYDKGTVFDEPDNHLSETIAKSVKKFEIDKKVKSDYYIYGYFTDEDYKQEIEFPFTLNNNSTIFVKTMKYTDAADITFLKESDYNKIYNYFIANGECHLNNDGIKSYVIWENIATKYKYDYDIEFKTDKEENKSYIEFFPEDKYGNKAYFKIGQTNTVYGTGGTCKVILEGDAYCQIEYDSQMSTAIYKGQYSYFKSGPTYETYFDSNYADSNKLNCTFVVKKYTEDKYIQNYNISCIKSSSVAKDYETEKRDNKKYRKLYLQLTDAFNHADTVIKKIDNSYSLWK